MAPAGASITTRRVSGGSDHLLTQYLYCGNLAVSAVGGWIMSKAFGFRQAFDLVFERANIQYDSTHSPSLVVQPHDKEPFSPEVSSDSGYDIEISHFVERILGAELPIVLTPQESRESVRLILAEVESAATGKVVAL